MSNSPPESYRHTTSNYAEEHQPQVAKHERLLEEEYDIVKRGIDTTRKLLSWYEQRVASLEKRKQMLGKGMVALDSAVHEQKLNFYRAQIAELNRRMNALMATSERGFPSHENMQIRNAVVPSSTSGSSSGGSAASRNSTAASTPEPQAAQYLYKQNQQLVEELEAKTRLIEQLQREKLLAEMRQAQFVNGAEKQQRNRTAMVNGYGQRPAAYVKPALHQAPDYAMLPTINAVKVKDTLL